MSRYIVLSLFIIGLFFGGCSVKKVAVNNSGESFEGEDLLTLRALTHHQYGEYDKAIILYKTLYEKSKNIAYLKEALKLAFIPANEAHLKELIEIAKKDASGDFDIIRMQVGVLLKEKSFKEAEEMMLALLKKEKSDKNLSILGSIYFFKEKYELALKYYDSAYKLKSDESSLLKIVELLDVHLNRTDEAISYLETFSRLQGCGSQACFRLIHIYGKQRNIDGLISTYKTLYKQSNRDEYAKKIVELLMYKKDREGAISFLKSTGYNQEMLLDIYASNNNFKDAFAVAKSLYKNTNDIEYLGRMGIYEYEMNKKKMTKKVLESVSRKFEMVVEKRQDPLYLNYYGYLLIDHDLDIKKGVTLVKMALEKEPNSIYYIDSLAWGLYKLGKCQDALQVIEKIMKNMKEEEVLEHYEKIKQCIGKKK